MRIEKSTNPMRLIINSTHIRFNKFDIINERVGGSYVQIKKLGNVVARLFDEDAQEFIKLMEQGK